MKQRNRNGARKWILGRSRPLKPLELSEFSRELGTMLQSGIPISRALDILSGEAGLRSRTREQYEALLTGIRRGEPPSQVMEEQNGAFPPLMISMFRAAESAGNLDRTALRLAEHYRREHRQRAQVAGALLYPKFLLALLILTAGLLTGFVLPQFASLFEWMDELPLPTRILYGVTGLVSERWYLIPAGAAAALFLWRAVSSIPFVREGLDRMKLHLPVLGGLLRTVYTARFARSFSVMYAAGVPVMTTLEISRRAIGNAYMDGQLQSAIGAVRSGVHLSRALEQVDGFRLRLSAAVRVGEESGSLESMLSAAADNLEYDAELAVRRMVSYVEPVMIVLMALLTGFVMAAVMLPIVRSYDAIEEILL